MITSIDQFLSNSGKSLKRSAIREIETGVKRLSQVISKEFTGK
jgi:hypothetical protein